MELLTETTQANVLWFFSGVLVAVFFFMRGAERKKKHPPCELTPIARAPLISTQAPVPAPTPCPATEVGSLTKHYFRNSVSRKPSDDGMKLEEYFCEGLYHCENGPAVIQRDRRGTVRREEYFRYGKRHRLDGPAVRLVDGTGWREEYWCDDKKHRDDGPAVILEKIDGSKREEFWADGELLHYSQVRRFCVMEPPIRMKPKPANGVVTTENDGKKQEEHYLNGKLHSTTGPARIVSTNDGSRWEEHWQHGQLISVARQEGSAG